MNKLNKGYKPKKDRNCFLYGMCVRDIVSKHQQAENISRFGLKILSEQYAG